ncbi:hypothetical protein BCR42DRAFT_398570 [Absidia repens]|uniref:Uncharacterized protein n=1 Tax=Absidia repens TaxID=90262 RepID=A0A1X2HY01_9FUNG|nr:hypothetical protein BCR42DRAFT_398570 [Absidia repens]
MKEDTLNYETAMLKLASILKNVQSHRLPELVQNISPMVEICTNPGNTNVPSLKMPPKANTKGRPSLANKKFRTSAISNINRHSKTLVADKLKFAPWDSSSCFIDCIVEFIQRAMLPMVVFEFDADGKAETGVQTEQEITKLVTTWSSYVNANDYVTWITLTNYMVGSWRAFLHKHVGRRKKLQNNNGDKNNSMAISMKTSRPELSHSPSSTPTEPPVRFVSLSPSLSPTAMPNQETPQIQFLSLSSSLSPTAAPVQALSPTPSTKKKNPYKHHHCHQLYNNGNYHLLHDQKISKKTRFSERLEKKCPICDKQRYLKAAVPLARIRVASIGDIIGAKLANPVTRKQLLGNNKNNCNINDIFDGQAYKNTVLYKLYNLSPILITHGTSKAANIPTFLTPLYNELGDLSEHGITVKTDDMPAVQLKEHIVKMDMACTVHPGPHLTI